MQDRSAATRFGVVISPGVEAIDIGGTVGFILMARRVPPAIDAVTIRIARRGVDETGFANDEVAHIIAYDRAWAAKRAALDVETG
jgi:hypothetical protein